MRKKRNDRKKLVLAKETLAPLEAQILGGAVGAAAIGCPQESNKICSIQHTCVSCVATQAPACA
jgi:hypothetical protein